MKNLSDILSVGGIALFLIMVIVLLIPSPVYSQCLSMQVSSTPATQLSPAEIDFEHFESRSLLFTVNITNSNINTVYAILHGSLDIHLADGTDFFDAITFLTDSFAVAYGGRTITNMNIGHNSNIKLREFNFRPDAKSRLQTVSLATGKFPDGRYLFHLQLEDGGCPQNLKTEDVLFVLQNLSRIELRSPADGDITNEFPFFEFFQEGSKVVLTVAEKNDDQSREDAITRKPPMLEVPLTGQNSFLYQSGRPLEQGKTYVWQIVSKSTGTGGSGVDVPSPIWSFTVSNSAQSGQEDPVLRQLENIFGAQYKTIFDQIRAGDFHPNGIFLSDGTTIQLNDLLNLLNDLRSNDTVEITFE